MICFSGILKTRPIRTGQGCALQLPLEHTPQPQCCCDKDLRQCGQGNLTDFGSAAEGHRGRGAAERLAGQLVVLRVYAELSRVHGRRAAVDAGLCAASKLASLQDV